MQAIVVRQKWTGRDLHTYTHTQSNLRTSLPCTTSLVVAGPNDQCGSVRKGGFRSNTGGLASLVRRSGFVAIGFRSGIRMDVTDRQTDAHNQIWGPHSVPTSLIVRDQRRPATTSCERHQSKVTLWNIYIYCTYTHAYIHTYINEHLAWLSNHGTQ